MATKPASESTEVKPIKRGRAPAHITQQDKDDFAEKRGAEFTQVQNTNAAIIAAGTDEQSEVAARVNQRIGRRQMMDVIAKLVTVTDLVDLQNLKISKAYKNFNASLDGKAVTITTWKEYCEIVEGRSCEAVDLDLKNLDALGPQLFESMRTIGLGPSTMRAIRQLPEEKQALIQQAIDTTNKDDLAEFVEQLIAKSTKEKEALTKKVDDLTQDNAAKDAVAETNSKIINQLREENVLIKKRPLSENVEQARKEIAEMQTNINHMLRVHLHDAFFQLGHIDPKVDQKDFIKGQIEEIKGAVKLLEDEYSTGVEWE